MTCVETNWKIIEYMAASNPNKKPPVVKITTLIPNTKFHDGFFNLFDK